MRWIRRIPLLAVLLAALVPTAGAEPRSATLATRDGSSVAGTIEMESFKVETSLGVIDVKMADVAEVNYNDKGATVRLWDATLLSGKLDVSEWSFKSKLGDIQIKPEKVARISFASRVVQAPYPPMGGGVPLSPEPRQAPAPREPELKPVKTLPLKASVSRLLLSATGATLYAMHANDGKVLVISTDTMAVEREVPLPADMAPANPQSQIVPIIALMPGGKRLVAASSRVVAIVDPAAGTVVKSFQIENEIYDLVAADEQILYATTVQLGLVSISIPKQSVTRKFGNGSGMMDATHDGQRIYMQGGTLVLPTSRSLLTEPAFYPHSVGESFTNNLRITADDRYAVSGTGVVSRLARSFMADLLPCGKVPEHLASGSMLSTATLLLFTGDGFMKEIDLATLEIRKSTHIGLKGYKVVVDESRKVFYLFGSAAGLSPSPGYYGQRGLLPPVGDIYKFELAK